MNAKAIHTGSGEWQITIYLEQPCAQPAPARSLTSCTFDTLRIEKRWYVQSFAACKSDDAGAHREHE